MVKMYEKCVRRHATMITLFILSFSVFVFFIKSLLSSLEKVVSNFSPALNPNLLSPAVVVPTEKNQMNLLYCALKMNN